MNRLWNLLLVVYLVGIPASWYPIFLIAAEMWPGKVRFHDVLFAVVIVMFGSVIWPVMAIAAVVALLMDVPLPF